MTAPLWLIVVGGLVAVAATAGALAVVIRRRRLRVVVELNGRDAPHE